MNYFFSRRNISSEMTSLRVRSFFLGIIAASVTWAVVIYLYCSLVEVSICERSVSEILFIKCRSYAARVVIEETQTKDIYK